MGNPACNKQLVALHSLIALYSLLACIASAKSRVILAMMFYATYLVLYTVHCMGNTVYYTLLIAYTC
jgi:hypothetical protein